MTNREARRVACLVAVRRSERDVAERVPQRASIKVEQLTKDFESKLAEQQKQIEALIAGLQRVSAQLEASKPAPQMVNNP